MPFALTYAGIVEANKDPLKLGRIKVRVPLIFGAESTATGYIATNDLPWALPAGMPAGGSALSGGFSQLPEPGDKVWVRFLDGEPEKPIWEWGMQSTSDAESLTLHSYDPGTPVGAPNRALWTRYAHALEINAGSIIVTTSQGYRMVLTDASDSASSDGNITITTKNGNLMVLDDADDTLKFISMEDMYFNVTSGLIGNSDSFSWTTLTQDFEIIAGRKFTATSTDGIELTTASDLTIDALGNASCTTTGDFTMGFSTLKLGLTAEEPVVLGNQLATLLESILIWLDTHTHTSATPGSPTSPPNVPVTPVALPTPAQCLSATVTVQN